MNRSKKIYVLLGVLLVACVLTFAVSRYETYTEQIKNSDEIILTLDGESVTSLAWEYESQALAFHKDDTWQYDEDENFPVSEEKIDELLAQFASFGASFIIEEVEDYGQYGLDDPLCTITIGTEDETYEILLGDYSTMDEERYVSLGDGNVYLVANDPMEAFELELKDMIQNDALPSYDTATQLVFSGNLDYTVDYDENNTLTYSAEDVYFTEEDGVSRALDTANVTSYLQTLGALGLSDYVSYNATEEELADCGLDEPELSVTVAYTTLLEDGETEETGSFTVHISRDPEEIKAAEEVDETEDETSESEEITAYARIGESQIIYQITGDEYEALMAASYNELRHQEIFWADFSDVDQVEISLDGTDYTLSTEKTDEETIWYYGAEELSISTFQYALSYLYVTEFTEEQSYGKEEISLTLLLDNENQPEVSIKFYRYDGSSCVAVVDGTPMAFVDRSDVVDLVEAVNAIVL